jgi:beta-galactosidase
MSESSARIEGGEVELTFDRSTGQLDSWEIAGTELLEAGPRLNLWRAPTDNDASHSNRQRPERVWRSAGLDRLEAELLDLRIEERAENAVRIEKRSRHSAPDAEAWFLFEEVWDVTGAGDCLLDLRLVPHVELFSLPRAGITLRLPDRFGTFDYLGRGPRECYRDRKANTPVGRHTGPVAEEYFPYVVPQEHGNHTDVRWAALTDGEGTGLLAVAQPTMDASASLYDPMDLSRARHINEVAPCGSVVFNLDYAQCGLGNGSCGTGVRPEYCLEAREIRFRLLLRSLQPGDDPAALARRRAALP